MACCIWSILSKKSVDRVLNVKSLGFYNHLFLVPKPHRRWRPVFDLSRLNTVLLVEWFKMETSESIRASDSKGMGIVDGLVSHNLHIPFHQSRRKYLTLSLGWIINQEKSELKPIQVFPFMGYEYHLDSALVKLTQTDGSIFRI